MVVIYFVRHGETEGNLKKIYIGKLDFPLNENGFEQARKTAEKLKDKQIDMIFCSPAQRAKQTMGEIAKFHHNAEIVFDDRLLERGDGELDGQPLSDEYEELRWDWNVDLNPKLGEPIKEAYKRVSNFYDEILAKYKNKNILIVSHCGIGKLSFCYFYGFPKNGNFNEYLVSNSEIAVFDQKN